MAAEKADFPVNTMAGLLGVSRSGFYDWARREPPGNPWADARTAVERCRLESDRRFGARAGPDPLPRTRPHARPGNTRRRPELPHPTRVID